MSASEYNSTNDVPFNLTIHFSAVITCEDFAANAVRILRDAAPRNPHTTLDNSEVEFGLKVFVIPEGGSPELAWAGHPISLGYEDLVVQMIENAVKVAQATKRGEVGLYRLEDFPDYFDAKVLQINCCLVLL